MKKRASSFISRNLLIFKSLRYLLSVNTQRLFWNYFRKHPFLYLSRFLSLFFQKQEKFSPGRHFFHGLDNFASFQKELLSKETFLFVGFSYCQRPKECPMQRFSNECQPISSHLACRECFIGNLHLSSSLSEIRILSTAHSLAKRLLEIQQLYPSKKILFLITACPFSQTFFAPWSQFLHLQGISFSLAGPICTNFSSFQSAEKGNKPLSTLLEDHQKRAILELLSKRKRAFLT
jgi:hypothetical protein